ncbi:hypothetical protein CCP1ISM_90016 [Azospirillaceae bacterium]
MQDLRKIADIIIDSIEEKPSTITEISDGAGLGVAWNTKDHYCDVELYQDDFVFTISRDRKHLEFVTMSDPVLIEYGITKLQDILRIK